MSPDFYIPDHRSAPYSFGRKLPVTVVVAKPDVGDGLPSPGTILEIVQAELVDGKDVVLGFVNGDDEGSARWSMSNSEGLQHGPSEIFSIKEQGSEPRPLRNTTV